MHCISIHKNSETYQSSNFIIIIVGMLVNVIHFRIFSVQFYIYGLSIMFTEAIIILSNQPYKT